MSGTHPNDGRYELVGLFAQQTGYRFKDHNLLTLALTHASATEASNENYERLEFLGDRVLGLVICEEIFHRFPKKDEGDLARRFNFLVRRQTCAEAAKTAQLDEMMRLGNGVNVASNSTGKKVLADIAEAVIAAVYLDGGLEAARSFILQYWKPFLAQAGTVARDAKTALQEWALAVPLPLPEYEVVGREGPDHQPVFEVVVLVHGYEAVSAKASAKRSAEQIAAQAFLDAHGLSQT